MDARRPFALAALVTAVIALGACSSVTAGRGTTGAGSPAPSGRVTASPSSSMPTDAAGLAALLERGVATVSSVHLSLDITAGPQSVRGSGDETLSEGMLSSLDLTETVSGVGILRLRIVDVNAYAAPPATLNHSGKPWVLVSSSSSDPFIRSLSNSLDSSRNAASLRTPVIFARAATSVKRFGAGSVNGAAATHYSVIVETSRLPSDYPGRQDIVSAGITTLPVELWIDTRGRPLRVSELISIQGVTVSSLITLSRFNAPVHIVAPPADQVSTS